MHPHLWEVGESLGGRIAVEVLHQQCHLARKNTSVGLVGVGLIGQGALQTSAPGNEGISKGGGVSGEASQQGHGCRVAHTKVEESIYGRGENVTSRS